MFIVVSEIAGCENVIKERSIFKNNIRVEEELPYQCLEKN
jgi:hypothetical protein